MLKNYEFYYKFIEQDNSYYTKVISSISQNDKKKIKKNILQHIKMIKRDSKKYLKQNGEKIVKLSFFEFFFKIDLKRRLVKVFDKITFKHKSIIPNIK